MGITLQQSLSQHSLYHTLPDVFKKKKKVMRNGTNSGKKLLSNNIVKNSFEIINLLTDKNPIQVLVDAVRYSGPREEIARVGGNQKREKVNAAVSPIRRVNQALWLLTNCARERSKKDFKTISECLADELIDASNNIPKSNPIKNSITRKNEKERDARAERK